jgi:protein-L-isoaspartate O-methyltransferase
MGRVLLIALALILPWIGPAEPVVPPSGSLEQTGARAPSRRPDVLYVPTPPDVVDAMLSLARVTADDVVYDLGAGDGRIVIAAARRYRARGVGVELQPALVAEARANVITAGVDTLVTIIEGDVFTTDLSPATVVTLYLLPAMNERLRPKLLRELRPGARIVSHDFPIGGWKPDVISRLRNRTIYLWRIPER